MDSLNVIDPEPLPPSFLQLFVWSQIVCLKLHVNVDLVPIPLQFLELGPNWLRDDPTKMLIPLFICLPVVNIIGLPLLLLYSLFTLLFNFHISNLLIFEKINRYKPFSRGSWGDLVGLGEVQNQYI